MNIKHLKHRSTPEHIAEVEAHIAAMCKRQGITVEQLYKLTPLVAAKATVYKEGSKWSQ
jgi:hypothetical protein